jgi:hypothetical protein
MAAGLVQVAEVLAGIGRGAGALLGPVVEFRVLFQPAQQTDLHLAAQRLQGGKTIANTLPAQPLLEFAQRLDGARHLRGHGLDLGDVLPLGHGPG